MNGNDDDDDEVKKKIMLMMVLASLLVVLKMTMMTMMIMKTVGTDLSYFERQRKSKILTDRCDEIVVVEPAVAGQAKTQAVVCLHFVGFSFR